MLLTLIIQVIIIWYNICYTLHFIQLQISKTSQEMVGTVGSLLLLQLAAAIAELDGPSIYSPNSRHHT